MKKIGVYGGSFDPIHLGHLNLATEIMEAHQLDEVLFCPAAINPHKTHQNSVSATHRLNMIRLAIAHEPRFSVTEIEIARQGLSYTVDTLKELHALQNDREERSAFFLILGEDSARTLHRWHQPEVIISLAQPLVGSRIGKRDALEPFEGSPSMIRALNEGLTPTRVMEISGTEIRERLLDKKPCYHLLPGKVMDYIITNRIYYPLLNEARFL